MREGLLYDGAMDPIFVLVAAVVGGGLGLICLARFARRRGQVLREQGFVKWKDNFTNAGIPRSFPLLFFGPQPEPLERLGVALAVLTAVAVIAAVAVVVVVLSLGR
jgi:hypothetical protein